MKIVLGRNVTAKMRPEEVRAMATEPCTCAGAAECDTCGGTVVVHIMPLSEDDLAAITENLRSQGVPIGTKQ